MIAQEHIWSSLIKRVKLGCSQTGTHLQRRIALHCRIISVHRRHIRAGKPLRGIPHKAAVVAVGVVRQLGHAAGLDVLRQGVPKYVPLEDRVAGEADAALARACRRCVLREQPAQRCFGTRTVQLLGTKAESLLAWGPSGARSGREPRYWAAMMTGSAC